MDTLVTVVIPVAKNHRHLLLHALESVHNSTIPVDVIVVNDDESALTVRGCTILNTGGKKGSAYARNLGTSKVTTPFVTYLDADDYLLNNALELMLREYTEQAETCYVYGGYYRLNKTGTDYVYVHPALYDRQAGLQRALHLVTTLLDVDLVRTVGGFDETYQGWEDFEFYSRLAVQGYCGTPIPYPIIIYDLGTSINREKHNEEKEQHYGTLYGRYESYIKGEQELMACASCGSKKSLVKSQVAIMPPEAQDGMVVLEYLGQNTAPIPFKVGTNPNKQTYRAGNDAQHKFIQVKKEHAKELLDRGFFRRVAKASKQAVMPTTQDFASWRARNTEVPVVRVEEPTNALT